MIDEDVRPLSRDWSCLFCHEAHLMQAYEAGQNAGRKAILESVNADAEADILRGGPVTGAHHRAIQRALEQLS